MSPSDNHRAGRDRGQATPLWAIVLVLAGLLLVPTGLLAKATIERSKAQNAADAAALAGALADPHQAESEARSIAGVNGARLEQFRRLGAVVEVVVAVGGRRATARALREEVPISP